MELAPRVSLAELREECARVKAAADPDPEATNRRIHAQRRLRHYRDGEGGSGTCPPAAPPTPAPR